MLINNSEYVLNGHPDRLTDGIAETIAMAIYNVDGWEGRSAVEALYTGNKFVVGGEFKTSLSDEAFKSVIDWIVKTILSKQTSEKIEVMQIWQKQSPEIHVGSLRGWGDNTIAYGYCSKTGHNATSMHSKLRELGAEITKIHTKELPDGKLIAFDGKTTISIEEGITSEKLANLNVVDPTIFKKSGANADSGVVGRKLIAERHGNGVPHGGGAFTGKDFTKGDKTMKLIADAIAYNAHKETGEEVLIQLSTKFGAPDFFIDTPNKIDVSKFKIKDMNEYANDIEKLYTRFSPVKPSEYLNSEDIKNLENLLLELSSKEELKNNIW